MQFSYLHTPPALYQLKPDPNKAFAEVGGRQVRRIFYNLPFTNYEIETIEQFKAYAQRQSIVIDCDDQNICRFQFKTCLERIQEYLDWIHNPQIQNISIKTKQLLRDGVIYTFGRDLQNRPIIFMDLAKINFDKYTLDDYYSVSNAVIKVVREHRFVKGVVENYLWVMDFGGNNLTSLNMGKMKQIIDKTGVVFSFLLGQMLIINVGLFTKFIWDSAKKFVHPDTLKRITLLSCSELYKMKQFIDEGQLLQRYGGIHPNLECYWPPQNNRKYQSMIKSFQSSYQARKIGNQSFSSAYFSIENNQQIFIDQQALLSNDGCCNKEKCNIF